MRARVWLLACVVVAAAVGCSSLPPPGAPPGAEARAAGGADPRQRLYRVQYNGPAGQGGLRLVLRLAAADRFQIAASDSLGRAVWSLDHSPGGVTLVDHREKRYCTAGSELRVPEVALAPLPLTALPRMLAGGLPAEPPPFADRVRPDWRDAQGRRWTARLEEGVPRSWTLWQGGEPQLWWLQQPRGGILSHREGSQFRWRGVVDEPLAAAGLPAFVAPPTYERGDCANAAGGLEP